MKKTCKILCVLLLSVSFLIPPLAHGKTTKSGGQRISSMEFSAIPLTKPTRKNFTETIISPSDKNVPVLELYFTPQTKKSEVEEIYFIVHVRAGDKPWEIFKELNLKNDNKIISRLDATKKSNWKQAPKEGVSGSTAIDRYLVYFNEFTRPLSKSKPKVQLQVSVQKNIGASVLKNIEANTQNYLRTSRNENEQLYLAYSVFIPARNGVTYRDANGKVRMLSLNKTSSPQPAVFVFVDTKYTP